MISVALLINVPNPSKPSHLTVSSNYFNNFIQIDENQSANNKFIDKKNKKSDSYKPETVFANESGKILNDIRFLIHKSFLSYKSKCQTSDYYQPISEGCLNSSGLSLTAVESLETLYISGLSEDFKTSANYILNDFTCSSSRFQNFHEMGTKVLGGLIGIYSFTKDHRFIKKAVECANVMKYAFKHSIPYPLLDGINHKAKKYSFIDGNLLSESSGFILEFTVLSKITGEVAYENYVQNYLQCILSIIKSSNSLPTTISVDKCQTSKKVSMFSVFNKNSKKLDEKDIKYNEINEYTISFIANVIRLHLYSPSNTTTEIIDFISDLLSNNNDIILNGYLFDSSFCQLSYLMKEIPKLKSTKFYKDLNYICQSISKNDFPVLKSDISSFPNLKVKNDGFYFDYIPLIDSNITEKSYNQLKYLSLLNTTQCKSAQCALISQDPIVYDDLMPTELLSKWLKFLYLSNSSVFDLSKKNWIINEAGHLIISNVI